jgi:hypothetical protein
METPPDSRDSASLRVEFLISVFPGEGVVSHSTRTLETDGFVSLQAAVQAFEEPGAFAEEQRHHVELHLIDQPRA